MATHGQNAGDKDNWEEAAAAEWRFVQAAERGNSAMFSTFGTAAEDEGAMAAALRTANSSSYPSGVGYAGAGQEAAAEWLFQQPQAALPLDHVFPAFGSTAEAEGGHNTSSYPSGVGYTRQEAAAEWSFPPPHAVLPLDHGFPAYGSAAEALGTANFNSYLSGVGYGGQEVAAEWSFQQPLDHGIFPAFGNTAEAEGAMAAALQTGNFNYYPSGVGYAGQEAAAKWLFPPPHAALPLDQRFPAYLNAAEALGTANSSSYPSGSGVGFAVHEAAAESMFPQLHAALPLDHAFSAFGNSAETADTVAAALWTDNFNSYPSGVGFLGHEAASEWSFAEAHTALSFEQGEPSMFPVFGTAAAAEAEGPVDLALSTGNFNFCPAGVGFHGNATADEWPPVPQTEPPLEYGDSRFRVVPEVEGAAATALHRTGDFINCYPAGHAAAAAVAEFPFAQAALPLAHESRSLFTGFNTGRDNALRTGMFNCPHAGVGLPDAHRHDGPTPLLQDHERVEAYSGENEELEQLDTLLSPEQPLPLQQVLGDAEPRAVRPVVQVEQLGPNDLQHCLRQGDSDRALDILTLTVHQGKANRAVGIEENERDINRAHPELVILLRGHGYFSIRRQGDTLRAESYYRKHIEGVYPDGVSTGIPFVDTLLAQLKTTARTGAPPSDNNHDFSDTNVTHHCVNDYLKVYFPEFRKVVEKGRTRVGLFGEKEGKWVRCLACHKEYRGYNRAKLQYHQLRSARGRQALCQASTVYIRRQIQEADQEDGSGRRRARSYGEAAALVPPPPDGAAHLLPQPH